MKQIFILFGILALCACEQQGEEAQTAIGNGSTGQYTAGSKEIQNAPINDWQQGQDSIRSVILRGKENELLKKGFLQEMYIRNVVLVSNDSLLFKIPFNLHGPDCGAPDCYSTDVSFGFKLGHTLVFPEELPFQEHEHGCTDRETHISGSFRLVEQTDKHVIYHSAKYQRTLALFNSNKDTGTTAFYFTGVEKGRISGSNIYNLASGRGEDFEEKDYPFTSWVLTTNDYERFIR